MEPTLTANGRIHVYGRPGAGNVAIVGHAYKSHGQEFYKGMVTHGGAFMHNLRVSHEEEVRIRNMRGIEPVGKYAYGDDWGGGPRKAVLPRHAWTDPQGRPQTAGGDLLAKATRGPGPAKLTRLGKAAEPVHPDVAGLARAPQPTPPPFIGPIAPRRRRPELPRTWHTRKVI